MMKKVSISLALVGLVVLVALLFGSMLSADENDEEMMVDVAITNLTRGQIMSPVFVARHDGNAGPLYTLGERSSSAMAKMAEDADASGLMDAWDPDDSEGVSEARVVALNNGPIPPGETVKMSFDIDDGRKYLSFASMLVSTNDAFIGANALDVSKSRSMMLSAYDSGSEANSEDCAYIPGPPCGNHAHDRARPEGFVHVHAGIHGTGESDLDPATHDWRDPVARLSIKTWKVSR